MSTRFTDIKFDPDVYASYLNEQSIVTNAFSQSGIVAQNGALDQRAKGPSNITTIPSWDELDASNEPNFSSDDPDSDAIPDKITTKSQTGRTAYLNNGWQAGDLLVEFNADDPMKAIAERTNRYWQAQFQRRLIASTRGILADNIANDTSDMVIDVSTDVAGAVADAERISATSVIDAMQTLGDQKKKIVAIGVHSEIHARLQKQNLIDYIAPSEGKIGFESYLGLRLIVDDGLPVETGSNRLIYTSVLFGSGAFGLGRGAPRTPVEISRKAEGADGGGIESLWERHTWLLHPLGYDFTNSSVSGLTTTAAELANAANWARVYNRKNIPLAFLKTNE